MVHGKRWPSHSTWTDSSKRSNETAELLPATGRWERQLADLLLWISSVLVIIIAALRLLGTH